MRTAYRWTVFLFLAGGAAGCTLPAHVRGPSWIDCLRAGTQIDPNTVLIETALIERPLGDDYLCRELWQDTDELVVGLEQRETLRENGLRVGQLVGTPPVGFQTMLLSPRSCTNPSRLMVPSGKCIPQYLGPVLDHCNVTIHLDGNATELALDQARFGFDLTATLTADGRTRVQFVPKIETAENLLPFQASPEDSTWVLRIERPSRRLAEQAFEATLAPGQYLVVGCVPEKAGSFGRIALCDEDGPRPFQRLLVIRTNRATNHADGYPDDEPLAAGAEAPVAVQASVPTR